MFCICSNKSIDEIIAAQADIPLPFTEMLECYTSCLSGCGSCIPVILERIKHRNVLMPNNG
jgi:bacterioferritin-associated ferredoxin